MREFTFKNVNIEDIVMMSDFWKNTPNGKVTNACYHDKPSGNYYFGTLQSKCLNEHIEYDFTTRMLANFKSNRKDLKRMIDWCYPKKKKRRIRVVKK